MYFRLDVLGPGRLPWYIAFSGRDGARRVFLDTLRQSFFLTGRGSIEADSEA